MGRTLAFKFRTTLRNQNTRKRHLFYFILLTPSLSDALRNSNDDACNHSPASAPRSYTVGSMTNSDSRSSFSGYGTCVNIFAPGSSIKVRAVAGWSLVIPWIFPGCSLGILAEVLLVVLLELVTPGGPNLVKTVEMMQRKEREEIYCRNPVLLMFTGERSKFRAAQNSGLIPLPVVIWLVYRNLGLLQSSRCLW